MATRTWVEPLYRCSTCSSESNMSEAQSHLGRCPTCGDSELEEIGAARVTYEDTHWDSDGRAVSSQLSNLVKLGPLGSRYRRS